MAKRNTPQEMFRLQQEAEQKAQKAKIAEKSAATRRRNKAAELEKAVAKFRSAKKDAGKWVFIGEKGKAVRNPTAKTKGIFAYITKTGKVRKQKAAGAKSLTFRTFGGYRLQPRTGKKSFGKFFAEKMLKASGVIRSNGNREVTYKQIMVGVRRMIPDSKGAKQIIIEANVYYKVGKKVHSVTVVVSQGAKQKLSKSDLARIVRSNLWGAISAQLRIQGYVSRASYSVVSKANKGEPKGEWTFNGAFWGKESLQKVKVIRIEYRSSEAKIRSGK